MMALKQKVNQISCLPIDFDLAKLWICVVGSDPIESKHIKGVCGSDSSRVFSKFKMEDSPYSYPNDSVKYYSVSHFHDDSMSYENDQI